MSCCTHFRLCYNIPGLHHQLEKNNELPWNLPLPDNHFFLIPMAQEENQNMPMPL